MGTETELLLIMLKEQFLLYFLVEDICSYLLWPGVLLFPKAFICFRFVYIYQTILKAQCI